MTTCAAKGKTRKTVKVKKGESYTFNTNKAAKYGANVRCTVTYRRTKTCKKMTISCSQFSLAAGDMVRVTRGKNRQTSAKVGVGVEVEAELGKNNLRSIKCQFVEKYQFKRAGASINVTH